MTTEINTQKFTGKADLYEKYRPSYPDELVDFLYDNARCEAVADIGAGTGKFTRCLLKKPWSVTAVEPNADMRAKLSEIAGLKIVNAPAEDTGLPERSFGLVTAAQAFHWFDAERFRIECRRILAEGGRLAVVWFSTNDEEGLGKRQMEISRKFCLDLIINQGHAGKRSAEEGDKFLRGGYFREFQTVIFPVERLFDRESFIGETLSRSYALKAGQPNYERFVEQLGAAFDEFQSGGKAAVKSNITVYLGQF